MAARRGCACSAACVTRFASRRVRQCARTQRQPPGAPKQSVHTLIDAARYRPLPPGRRSAGFALVDAFAPDLYTGNPAAVVRLAAFDELSPAAMQAIAAELNASATAFIAPAEAPGGTHAEAVYDIRWFSVAAELPICGHATFGAAKALLATGVHPLGSSIRFCSHMGAGNLLVVSNFDETLELTLPSLPPMPDPDLLTEPHTALRANLLTALGIDDAAASTVHYAGRNKYDIVVEVDSVAVVESLAPNQQLLKTIDCRGVIVTAAGRSVKPPGHWPSADFVSRFFAPSMGIPEDPATGSALCLLAPYWAQRLGRSDGLVGFQASRRGGSMEVALRCADAGTGDEASVVLRSAAQVVVDGTITLPSALE